MCSIFKPVFILLYILCIGLTLAASPSDDATSIEIYLQDDNLTSSHIDTTIIPWSQMTLTDERMKQYTLPAVIDKKFPYWIPISGGAIVGGGVIIYVLTREEDDTTKSPPIAVSDMFELACSTIPQTFDVLNNDSGENIRLKSVEQPSNALITIDNDRILVSLVNGRRIEFAYTIIDKNNLESSATVIINVIYPAISAVDDRYKSENNEVVGNLLENDAGEGIILNSYEIIPEVPISINENGEFSVNTTSINKPEISFEYSIVDACNQLDTAVCVIEIPDIEDCDLTVTTETTDAECGLDNGTASIKIVPAGNYDYEWSDGAIDSIRTDLSAGNYIVIISDGTCRDTIEISINSTPPDYQLSGMTEEATCISQGEILVHYVNPYSDNITVEVAGPQGTREYVSTTSPFRASEFFSVEAGDYTITIWSQKAGKDCDESISLVVSDETPEIDAVDDFYQSESGEVLNFNVLENDIGLSLELVRVTDVVGGEVDFDEIGNVIFTPDQDFVGEGGFNYFVEDACGSEEMAQVFITIENSICDFDVNFNVVNAHCGLSDGVITLEVTPSGSYQFLWSDGATVMNRININAGTYQVTVTDLSDNCMSVESVLVADIIATILTRDDSYFIQNGEVINFNVLDNDDGLSLELVRIENVIGGQVDFAATGDVMFTPEEDFTGEGGFDYFVKDVCGTEDMAHVFITIENSACDFVLNHSVVEAHCGLNDGEITIEITPDGDFDYIWSDGVTEKDRSNLFSGKYSVTATEIDGDCVLEETITVEELPAHYIENIEITEPQCNEPGDIEFDLVSPGSGSMNVQVIYGSGSINFTTGPGHVRLSDYLSVLPATYSVFVIDESVDINCIDNKTIIVENGGIPPVISISELIPPSSPDLNDGIMIGRIEVETTGPYEKYVDGVFTGTTLGPEFFIANLPVGSHEVYLRDSKGCISNLLEFSFNTAAAWELRLIHKVASPTVLPSSIEHPAPGMLEYSIPEFEIRWADYSAQVAYTHGYHEAVASFGELRLMRNKKIQNAYVRIDLASGILARAQTMRHSDIGLLSGAEIQLTLREIGLIPRFAPISLSGTYLSSGNLEAQIYIQVPLGK